MNAAAALVAGVMLGYMIGATVIARSSSRATERLVDALREAIKQAREDERYWRNRALALAGPLSRPQLDDLERVREVQRKWSVEPAPAYDQCGAWALPVAGNPMRCIRPAGHDGEHRSGLEAWPNAEATR